MRRRCSEDLGLAKVVQKVPDATGKRRVRLLVRLSPRHRMPDADAFDKLLLDSLVVTRLLTDDDASGLEGRVEVQFEHGTREDWGTEIQIEDVE